MVQSDLTDAVREAQRGVGGRDGHEPVAAHLRDGLRASRGEGVVRSRERDPIHHDQLQGRARHVHALAQAHDLVATAQHLQAGAPGVVAVGETGHAEEQRPYNPESATKIVDVNGTGSPASHASSDERATKELEDSLTQRPGRSAEAPRIANLAPYQANVPAQP